jgi:hypothetical protein
MKKLTFFFCAMVFLAAQAQALQVEAEGRAPGDQKTALKLPYFLK